MDIGIGNELLTKLVRKNLSEYLGYDIDELLKYDYSSIFGGSVRDSLLSEKINDLDLVILPNHRESITNDLKERGFIHLEEFGKMNMINMYKKLNGIIEKPITFIKDNCIIQIIIPTTIFGSVHQSYYNIITNVDLSCCAVYYDGHIVRESHKNGYIDIFSKTFTELKEHKMYNEENIMKRVYKLEQRGWIPIERINRSEQEQLVRNYIKSLNREHNLDDLLKLETEPGK